MGGGKWAGVGVGGWGGWSGGQRVGGPGGGGGPMDERAEGSILFFRGPGGPGDGAGPRLGVWPPGNYQYGLDTLVSPKFLWDPEWS